MTRPAAGFTPAPGFAAPAPRRDPAPAPPMDAQRAIMAQAFCALIDQTLSNPARTPRAGLMLLQEITLSGLGIATADGTTLTLDLFNITVASTGITTNPDSLLRDWQSAARNRLSQGVRR